MRVFRSRWCRGGSHTPNCSAPAKSETGIQWQGQASIWVCCPRCFFLFLSGLWNLASYFTLYCIKFKPDCANNLKWQVMAPGHVQAASSNPSFLYIQDQTFQAIFTMYYVRIKGFKYDNSLFYKPIIIRNPLVLPRFFCASLDSISEIIYWSGVKWAVTYKIVADSECFWSQIHYNLLPVLSRALPNMPLSYANVQVQPP